MNTPQTKTTGVEALATTAWNTYYELIGVAAKNGFTPKEHSATAVTLKHATYGGEIVVRIDVK